MSIVVGTDFSAASAETLRAAAAWAKRTNEKLVVVHATGLEGTGLVQPGSALDQVERALLGRLEGEVSNARGMGAETDGELLHGDSDATLVARAGHCTASLLVVGAVGRRGFANWLLGSTADRVARSSRRPVLVVRAALPLEDWLSGKRALKVAVAFDRTPTAQAALQWAMGLEKLGRIELSLLHSYSLAEEHRRRKIAGPLPIGQADPAVTNDLGRELADGARAAGCAQPKLLVEGTLGRASDGVCQMARAQGADLVVVGNHHHQGLLRAWHGSVSQGVIEHCHTNVASISVST